MKLSICGLFVLVILGTFCVSRIGWAADPGESDTSAAVADSNEHKSSHAEDAEILGRYVRELESVTRYKREHAITELRKADTMAVLRAFKINFPLLMHEGRWSFSKGVLPYLCSEDANDFLFKELVDSFAVQLKCRELAKRAKKEGPSYELEQAFKDMEDEQQWWYWLVKYTEDLSYVPSYDDVYAMFLKLDPMASHVFARDLYRRNPRLAEQHFSRLLLAADPNMQRLGIQGFRGAGVLPRADIAKAFFASADGSLLDEADQLVLLIGREDLEMLLWLVGNRSERVRAMAEYQLGRLAYMTREQAKEITAGTETPEARAKVWRQWWEQHREESEHMLRESGVKALIEQAKKGLSGRIMDNLSRYGDFSEVYALFNKGLSSSNVGLQKKAAMCLRSMAGQGYSKAADILIAHCENVPVEQWSTYADYVIQIEDKRVEKLFVGVLKGGLGKDTACRRRILAALRGTYSGQSLPESHRGWASRALVKLVLDKGDYGAARVFESIGSAEEIVPELLEAMLEEPTRSKRYAIRAMIQNLGCAGLAKELTRVLPETPESSEREGGVRCDVLQLMEQFPDDGAKPLLLELLKSKNPWHVLGAARVLGKLGDDSGVEALVEILAANINISQRNVKNHVGKALRAINSPRTQGLLESLYGEAELPIKKLVLEVMAEQGDPSYLDFLANEMETGESKIAVAARLAVAHLLYACNKDESEELGILDQDDLEPIRMMLLWAFFNEKIKNGDEAFIDHRSLKKLKGAVVGFNRYQQIKFTCDAKQVKLLEAGENNDMTARDGEDVGRGKPYSTGHLSRLDLGDYVEFFLSFNNGSCGYLFKHEKDKWVPVGATGGVVY